MMLYCIVRIKQPDYNGKRENMNRIEISIDGARYKQFVSLHEKQIENIKQSEERVKQASEAYEQVVWDNAMKIPTATDEQTEANWLLEKHAECEYRAAVENVRDASKRAVATAVKLVAELIHDNIDTLAGKCLNSKAVFIALNEALPEDIYISTNRITEDTVLYVEVGASSLRFAQYLHPNSGDTHIRPCRTDSDIISKQRFMSDYDQGLYSR